MLCPDDGARRSTATSSISLRRSPTAPRRSPGKACWSKRCAEWKPDAAARDAALERPRALPFGSAIRTAIRPRQAARCRLPRRARRLWGVALRRSSACGALRGAEFSGAQSCRGLHRPPEPGAALDTGARRLGSGSARLVRARRYRFFSTSPDEGTAMSTSRSGRRRRVST